MKARKAINNFLRFEFKLRGFWILIFFLGLALIACADLPAFIGAAFVGFATSAFFSRPDQFVLRGAGDAVYLVENRPLIPSVYHLADRETMNAFGGKWHEISHVSEHKINCARKCFYKGELSLSQATLYRPPGAKSHFAVLNGTRHGIPDPKTLQRIWDSDAKIQEKEVDCFLPGRDLVSEQFWPPQDRCKESGSS